MGQKGEEKGICWVHSNKQGRCNIIWRADKADEAVDLLFQLAARPEITCHNALQMENDQLRRKIEDLELQLRSQEPQPTISKSMAITLRWELTDECHSDGHNVRERPDKQSTIIGIRKNHEQFDGYLLWLGDWLKLSDEPGYCLVREGNTCFITEALARRV